MTIAYTYPGVFIEEITGPGVIAGVGTSTPAFIGPAARGPLNKATVITSFDDFASTFGEALDNWPYLERRNRRYFLGHGVQGFFENGGATAVIVRVGNGTPATWKAMSQPSAGAPQELFELQALAEGTAGNGYTVSISAPAPTGTSPKLAYAKANVSAIATDRTRVTIAYQGAMTSPDNFKPGDIVALSGVLGTSTVLAIGDSGGSPQLVLDNAVPATATPATVEMAPIGSQTSVRLQALSRDLQGGSVVELGAGTVLYAIVDSIDNDGFVSLRGPFQDVDGNLVDPAHPVSISNSPTLQSLDFGLTIADASTKVLDTQTGLSLDPFHSGYVFQRAFASVRIVPPKTPPATTVVANLIPAVANLTAGIDDDPTSVTAQTYVDVLRDVLQDVDAVSIVCAPDAANDPDAQRALRDHCVTMKDRIAVLDVPLGRLPANSPSALDHLQALGATSGGFAALYYPWLTIPTPVRPGQSRPLKPQFLVVPPSGHVAGVFARVDQTLGVHTPPANTEIRGVTGLERVLSDREQGLINIPGVNALRIFPGDGRVLVWGARTIAPQGETDWTYVNVRRLLFFIEESIQRGIRWAVFKPNDYGLWQSLKRTIGSFLDRVWKDGGLVGIKREQAYQVRIDDGLNPPDEIALGRLHIEIKVAPVRPAEFIVVRIGLWDGGAQVTES